MKTVIARGGLEDENAHALLEFVQDQFASRSEYATLGVVYVKDDKGRTFTSVMLEEETLTDGSKVRNLILGGIDGSARLL